jgi:hypothetical protein
MDCIHVTVAPIAASSALRARQIGGRDIRGQVGDAVAGQRGPPAIAQPCPAGLARSSQKAQQQVFVIAAQAGQVDPSRVVVQQAQHARAVGAMVDVIAHQHDRQAARHGTFQQGDQQIGAPMHIADGDKRPVRRGWGCVKADRGQMIGQRHGSRSSATITGLARGCARTVASGAARSCNAVFGQKRHNDGCNQS